MNKEMASTDRQGNQVLPDGYETWRKEIVNLIEHVKLPEDKPTIGLLLCRSKSDTKARFALRGVTQPLGIAQYETEQLFADVASVLPQIEDYE